MAMGPERSKPLHNFSLPCLKWGSQRFFRCVQVSSNAAELPSLDRRSSRSQPKSDRFQVEKINPQTTKSSPPYPFQNSKCKSTAFDKESEDNIEAIREKLVIDFRVAAKKLKVSILEGGGKEEETATNARPWNLRTRRAACKAPPEEEEKKAKPGSSPRKSGEAAKENPVNVEKNERVKLSVSLSKEEVEEDFALMVGKRPPRRPKKRPRSVRRQLDSLFPGLWLSEVTPESYEVPDIIE